MSSVFLQVFTITSVVMAVALIKYLIWLYFGCRLAKLVGMCFKILHMLLFLAQRYVQKCNGKCTCEDVPWITASFNIVFS